jgi:hypothetical protein
VIETDFKSIYKHYFRTRNRLLKLGSCEDIIRDLHQRMGKTFTCYTKQMLMDSDLTWTSFSIWPFGKGLQKNGIFQAYLNRYDYTLCGFNPVALKKILGIKPIYLTKPSCRLFQCRKQFISFIKGVEHTDTKITLLKNISLLAVDSYPMPVRIYIRKINDNMLKLLFLFERKHCLFSRYSYPESSLIIDKSINHKQNNTNNVYRFLRY